MGSLIEINDTLQINEEQGFPADILNIEKHLEHPIQLEDVNGKVFSFGKKDRVRIYQIDPVRVYLVQNINGKWLFWGRVYIQSQSINKKLDANGQWQVDQWETSGTFIIIDIYDPAYQRAFTIRESPAGKSYF